MAARSAAIEITPAVDFGLDLTELGERARREVTTASGPSPPDPVQVTVTIDDVSD